MYGVRVATERERTAPRKSRRTTPSRLGAFGYVILLTSNISPLRLTVRRRIYPFGLSVDCMYTTARYVFVFLFFLSISDRGI